MRGAARVPRIGQLVSEQVEEAPGHARGDDSVTVGHGPDGSDKLRRQDVLQDEAAGAEPKRSERVLVQVEGCEDQDSGTRLGRDDRSRRLDAVHARHPDVQHYDVGVAAAREIHRSGAVGGLADDDDAFLLFQDHAEALARQRLIVDEDDRDRVASGQSIAHGAADSLIGIAAVTVQPRCEPGPAVAVPP
jgi:hypothetical protein